MFLDKVIEQIQKHILCSMIFFLFLFFLIPDVYEIPWKNLVGVRQATDDNTAHAHCTRDT